MRTAAKSWNRPACATGSPLSSRGSERELLVGPCTTVGERHADRVELLPQPAHADTRAPDDHR